jgi:SAM-dependent methyltransferase
MENSKIKANQENWDKTYTQFEGWCALPTWGPYEVCKDDPTLIGDIKDKTFLEICCGSGHSIKYLIENGAKKVYAVDFSESQINLAKKTNVAHLDKVKFILSPMEKLIELPEKVDTVFSVYGIGWTLDPALTFKNIFSYLKSGGKFVWSWDHGVFLNSKDQNGKVVVTGSYHDESEHHLETFYSGEGVYQAFRKTSTWFQFLRDAGFEINRYLEPKPININEDIATISSPEMARYYSPAKAEKIPSVIVFECIKK